MTQLEQNSTTAFVDAIDQAIQTALDSLFLHEDSLADIGMKHGDPQGAWTKSLDQLETTVRSWQAILDEMGEKVHAAQAELADLDGDLKRAMGTFTTARKHLEAGDVSA
jgi:hypothetical protein